MTIVIMLLLYISTTVNLLLLLGLFQRNCQVTLTGCDDVSNDSGINIETIEESQHIRYGNEEDFESSYAETTRASKATKATKATNKDHRINFSQERSNSKKKSSELEIVLYVWFFLKYILF